MPSKKKPVSAGMPVLPSIPKVLIEQLVAGGQPMTAEQINAATMALKKALIERALSAGFYLHTLPPFRIDGAIDGGCGLHYYGGTCLATGSYGFRVPRVAPGSEVSCRVRLVTNDVYTEPSSFPTELVDEWMRDAKTGGALFPDTAPPLKFLRVFRDPLFADGFGQ